ncbi:hypothetical protein [Acidithiobacillus sp.]|uniref:hypothetical protein n=1 Tax=Acidithiobacillus sp. TaxID=1872118 RepID=UPI00262E8ECC|nr:hypothetical protein [Acidithiobacillus sp.]MDD5280898.1 hypothetical protein [Acidithiobacillus sp.]
MNKPQLRAMTSFAVLGLALGMAGCGSSHHGDTNATASSATTQSAQQTGANSPVANALNAFNDAKFHRLTVGTPVHKAAVGPMPDWNTSIKDYVPLVKNEQMAEQYAAHAQNLSDSQIASILYTKYATQKDVFKKQEMLKKLKPVMDKQLAEIRRHPYVYTPMLTMSLRNYSFKDHGFKVWNTYLLNGGTISFSTRGFHPVYNATLINYKEFSFLPVENTTLAKKIENFVAKGQPIYVRVYMFVNGTGKWTVKAVGTRIHVYSPNKHLLMSYTPHHA